MKLSRLELENHIRTLLLKYHAEYAILSASFFMFGKERKMGNGKMVRLLRADEIECRISGQSERPVGELQSETSRS